MNTRLLTIIFLTFFGFSAKAQKANSLTTKKELVSLIDQKLILAADQYKYFTTQVVDSLFPKTLKKDGTLESSKSYWWCSGFFPGTLIYLNENKADVVLGKEITHRLKLLEREKNNKGTHDLGFMMYCSYGNAQRLTPDQNYQNILVQSAKSLSTRFNTKTGTIRSWNAKKPGDFIVIIDNMMNLELLFYATKVTGDSSFYKIAVSHADQTLKNHFRKDYSSYHVVDYNPANGAITEKRTHQGAADSSAWARGQAWGLYGYTVMYRETKQQKYLDLANNIAEFILNHPNLPKDKVPYWDFDAPGIPNALRDASAAAVMSSALIELATYNKGIASKKYLSASEEMITSLSSETYFNKFKDDKGFLLKHSVGSFPHHSEIDVPLTYADYYYVEAMMRYKRIAAGKNFLGE